MIQESLKEMRELGSRLMQIERIRYRLRRENAPKEAFQDLGKRHRAELALSKTCEKRLVIGMGIAFSLVVLGIFSGAIAMVCFRGGNLVGGVILAAGSILTLHLG